MRWILCGKNEAAVGALEHLVGHGDEVWAIGTSGDEGRDGWQPSFRAAAERLGVAYAQPERINAPEVVARLRDFQADALISIQYDQILKANLFAEIGCPCLNLHFALLPRHRGVAPIAWAILEGDAEAGVSLHEMVVEIDAGKVIAQRRVPILPTTTARELYEALCSAAGSLFAECYPFAAELLARRVPQDESAACYHRQGDFDFSKRVADWRRPARDLHRWLRAMIFPPLQLPEGRYARRRLLIRSVGGDIEGASAALPGTILETYPTSVLVAAADGAIRLDALVDPERPEASSEAICSGVRVGDRFEMEEIG
jgi:methionyl-tRNA formyltransferase